MSKQPPPAPTASAVSPCPTIIKISRTPWHWKFTQHHRTTRPPPKYQCIWLRSRKILIELPFLKCNVVMYTGCLELPHIVKNGRTAWRYFHSNRRCGLYFSRKAILPFFFFFFFFYFCLPFPLRLGSGPGCSKLTTSLVNVSLNFQKLISLTCQYFCWKTVRSFCSAKASHTFFNKKFQCIWL